MDPNNEIERRIVAAGIERDLGTAFRTMQDAQIDIDEMGAWAKQINQDREDSGLVGPALDNSSLVSSMFLLGYELGKRENQPEGAAA
jgi:hypothetical protein